MWEGRRVNWSQIPNPFFCFSWILKLTLRVDMLAHYWEKEISHSTSSKLILYCSEPQRLASSPVLAGAGDEGQFPIITQWPPSSSSSSLEKGRGSPEEPLSALSYMYFLFYLAECPRDSTYSSGWWELLDSSQGIVVYHPKRGITV